MNRRFPVIISLILALCACGREELPTPHEVRGGLVSLSFSLSADRVESKTSLSGTSVLWQGSDKLSVFDSQANRRFSVSEAGANVQIKGEALAEDNYLILYPYDAQASVSGGIIRTLLPDVQKPVAGGFDAAAALSAASSSGNQALMKNVCGLLRFSIASPDVVSISIRSLAGEKFSGHLSLRLLADGTPSVESAGSSSVTVLPSEGGTFAAGTYHVALAPVNMTGGVEVRLLKKDGRLYCHRNGNPLVIERSVLTTFPRPLDEVVVEEAGPTSDYLAVTSAHPRLFANDTEFREYRRTVLSGSSPILYMMHEEVMRAARRLAVYHDVMSNELDLSGRRMLDMARDVFGRIFFLAYAYRFTGERQFLDRADDLLNQICNFPDWNAHNHYLDTSTLTQAASTGYDWLYSDLADSTKAKLEDKVFAYSLSDCLTRAASYINPASGWNTTITSGMIMGGIAFYEVNPSHCNTILSTAVPSNYEGLRHLLGTDGCDPMGTMYWRNFITMEMLSISALKSVYMTDFGTSDFDGYRLTPTWYLYMVGSTGKSFTFGDNNESTDIVPAMFYFSALFDDPSLPYYELKYTERTGRVSSAGASSDTRNIANRTYPLILLWASKYRQEAITHPSARVFKAIDGVQPMVVARSGWGKRDLYLALKGGQANTNHGHMDAGTICYEAYGCRWIGDPERLEDYSVIEQVIYERGISSSMAGAGSYWDLTNGSPRWMAFENNCRQHSTFIVNDTDHYTSGNARVTEVIEGYNEMGAVVDMTSTLNGQVSQASRKAIIKEDNYLEITDRIEALPDREALVRWNICTTAVPEIVEDGILLVQNDEAGNPVSLILKAESAYPIEYRIFTSDPSEVDHPSPFCDIEAVRENEYFCGFTLTVPAGAGDDIKTTLKKYNK